MRKLVAALLCAFLAAAPLAAFDLLVPSAGETTYDLTDDRQTLTVDESYIYKTVFNRAARVNRYSDTITVLEFGDDDGLAVFLNAGASEAEGVMRQFARSYDDLDILLVNTPLTRTALERIADDLDTIYTPETLSSSTRSLFRSYGVDFEEIGEGAILRITDDDIRVISGAPAYSDGVYVTCPTCGTRIYVPFN